MSRATGSAGGGIIGAAVIAAQSLTHFAQMPGIDVRAIGNPRVEAAAGSPRTAAAPL